MIVLIGPTGETARRIIEIARMKNVELRLGARHPVDAKRRLGSLCDGFVIDRVDARDGASLQSILNPGDVLLNAATPAGQLGHAMARAAIGRGAHYVAFTGEVVDTLRLLRELDGPARERGVTLCPGAGSSGAVGDLALRFALSKLPDATDGYIGASITGFTPSYGTLLSEMHIMNGPGVIVRDAELVQEHLTGRIYRRDGISFIERPLIDPMMCWTYAGLDNLSAGIEVSEESVGAVSAIFRETADALSTDAGRVSYLEKIASSVDIAIPENDTFPEGTRTVFVWSGSQSAKVVISSRPVYEATARAAFLVSSELAELGGRQGGFQALTSIVRSKEYAFDALGSRVLAEFVH